MKDYIYMGGKLIAEYRHQENSYFYYATDQIGSTRIVTDDTGAVVYAAAHDPYGGIQQTWTNAYDPALKFSGKERDSESGLDYFGARYYDHSLYRFLSVDPVIPAGKAVVNPQRWNLYAYCGNNPVNYVDPDGRELIHVSLTVSPGRSVNPYLNKDFNDKLLDLIQWATDNQISLGFNEAYRTDEEHKKYQKDNTNAAKGPSSHQLGRAVDIHIDKSLKDKLDNFKIKIKNLGLWCYTGTGTGGGEFIHIELKISGSITEEMWKEVEKEYNKLVNAIKKDQDTIASFYWFLSDPWFTYGPLYYAR